MKIGWDLNLNLLREGVSKVQNFSINPAQEPWSAIQRSRLQGV